MPETRDCGAALCRTDCQHFQIGVACPKDAKFAPRSQIKEEEPEEGYALLMPFLDPSESFVLGFECGQLWQAMTDGKEPENYLVHTKNMPQLEMMAKKFKKALEINSQDGEWAQVSFIPLAYYLKLVPRV